MEIEATLRLRHARLKALRKEAGLSQPALHDASGVNLRSIRRLESLDFAFRGALDVAQDLADFFDVSREEILPEKYLGVAVEANRCEVRNVDDIRSLQGSSQKRLVLPAPDDTVVVNDRDSVIRATIAELPAREAAAVRAHSEGLTANEVAKRLVDEGIDSHQVGRQRAQQIVNKGLRMLEWRLVRSPAFAPFLIDKKRCTPYSYDAKIDLTSPVQELSLSEGAEEEIDGEDA
jgi:transcriptional regulator with XRE-family HTH domain